jgi:hypothetical protein
VGGAIVQVMSSPLQDSGVFAGRERERAVLDRLHKLRVILPAMAEESATARREAARLRAENARLVRRLAELEAAGPSV